MQKIIKISSGSAEFSNLLLRQTPNNSGIWAGNKFVVNRKIDKCDWWIICHGTGLIEKETSLCDPEHLIYISMEPSELIIGTTNEFLSQFSRLVICDRAVRHKNILYKNVITWWAGIEVVFNKGAHKFSKTIKKNYDDFKLEKIPDKLNRVSIIVSSKKKLPGHRNRIKFIEALEKSPAGKYLDIYGDKHLPILDKWDAIAPYKYHLVIENSQLEDYWSEKIGDSYIGYSYPIYLGCPNIDNYFPKKSYSQIEFGDVDLVSKLIINLIDNDKFSDSINEISAAREMVLEKYNIFQVISDLCEGEASKYTECTLYPNRYYLKLYKKYYLKFIKIINYYIH